MVVVLLDQIWIDVNFKEIQFKYMCIGQLVEICFDFYGSDVCYSGIVDSFGVGIGSVFFLLLVQNVIGNWIKIVQWVLVCIYIDL